MQGFYKPAVIVDYRTTAGWNKVAKHRFNWRFIRMGL